MGGSNIQNDHGPLIKLAASENLFKLYGKVSFANYLKDKVAIKFGFGQVISNQRYIWTFFQNDGDKLKKKYNVVYD